MGASWTLVVTFLFFPVPSSPSFPFPYGGREPQGSKSRVPSEPCWLQVPPGPHLLPTPLLLALAPQSYRTFTVSSHCFLPHWKRARNNVSRCQHPSPASQKKLLSTERPSHLGRFACCADLGSRLPPLPSALHPSPKQAWGQGWSFFDFLTTFHF